MRLALARSMCCPSLSFGSLAVRFDTDESGQLVEMPASTSPPPADTLEKFLSIAPVRDTFFAYILEGDSEIIVDLEGRTTSPGSAAVSASTSLPTKGP